MSKPPRVLFWDLENAPNLGWTWGKWEQNVIQFKQNWYMLSFSYKWQGEKRIKTRALCDYPGYSRDKENDGKLVRDLWKVLDEADVAIGHNADRFDTRKANARFAFHGLKPPSPFKSVDTLKIARRHFQFDSNKLNDLGHYLGVGHKLPHTGANLWFGCMAGDPKCWRTMKRYNAQDVALLERIYLKLRPWSSSHPDLTNFTRSEACPVCQSHNIQNRGFNVTKTMRSPRMQCRDCGKWFSGPRRKV